MSGFLSFCSVFLLPDHSLLSGLRYNVTSWPTSNSISSLPWCTKPSICESKQTFPLLSSFFQIFCCSNYYTEAPTPAIRATLLRPTTGTRLTPWFLQPHGAWSVLYPFIQFSLLNRFQGFQIYMFMNLDMDFGGQYGCSCGLVLDNSLLPLPCGWISWLCKMSPSSKAKSPSFNLNL